MIDIIGLIGSGILMLLGTYILVTGAEPIFKHKPSRVGLVKVIIGELCILIFFITWWYLLTRNPA